MQEIIVEIKIIEEHYAKAHYPETYQALRNLCTNNMQCEAFSTAAVSILSRYNDLENDIMNGLLDLTEQRDKKNQIRQSYDILIRKMKVQFQDIPPSCYAEQALRMRENRDALRNTLHAVEDDLENCTNEAKSQLLWNIREQLNTIIKYFGGLIKNFKTIQNYE